VIEVVDLKGNPLPYDSYGEIVLTSLSRQAMPLLRYRSGDLGRLINAPCPCGSVMDRIEVKGRLHEVISLSRARRISLYDITQALYSIPYVTGFKGELKSSQNSRLSMLVGSLKLDAQSSEEILEVLKNITLNSVQLDIVVVSPSKAFGGTTGEKPTLIKQP
jgi:phenylacetate-coenzyme A ligase PaaK-like adenylate-forming protein